MHMTNRFLFAVMGSLALLLVSVPKQAAGENITTHPERIVYKAAVSLSAFHDDPQFDDLGDYVGNAWGVLVIPQVIRGGFLFGAEHGEGVLLLRNLETGGWSEPSFVRLVGGSFGVQAGGKSSDVIITLMNGDAIDRLLTHKLNVKADVGVAVGPLGAGVGAGTTTHLGEDYYLFEKSQGLFGGMTIGGSAVLPQPELDQVYYGRAVTINEIARDPSLHNPATKTLIDALSRTMS